MQNRKYIWLGPLFVFLACVQAEARDVLVMTANRVKVYTGPGKNYRPLIVLHTGDEVQVSPKLYRDKKRRGTFYRVLVPLSTKKKAIGYIPVNAAVRKKVDMISADDMESFKDYPLADRAIQTSLTMFKSERRLASAGFVQYVGPGFYLKGWLGGFQSPIASTPVVGVELGNDANLYGKLSGFFSFGGGVFISPQEDSLFPGNKSNISNFIVQTAIGTRYNFDEKAAIGLGGTQAAIFSANNSLVTWGVIATLEWGI